MTKVLISLSIMLLSIIFGCSKETNSEEANSNNEVSPYITNLIDETQINQEYLGGYIEIQPDSYTGGNVPSTNNTDNKWGIPSSLIPSEIIRMRETLLNGKGTGFQFIRFPLGYAYRGYRNIDKSTGLAKNIGERFSGQNESLKTLFQNISKSGGGLAPEYWCPPPYWLTGGAYNGDNQIWAGGDYPRSTTLASIKDKDPKQYNAQIESFTDAIVNDFEYLHQNIAPVRMYGLQNEPAYSKTEYGACAYDALTYNDVLEILHPKILSSKILSKYAGKENKILLHVASDDHGSGFNGIASTFIKNHKDWIWGYSHHKMRLASGETSGSWGTGADWYKSADFRKTKEDKTNVFLNEFEYFTPTTTSHEYKMGNNMLNLINQCVYSDAKVLHPIIHIGKPIGHTARSGNTDGYGLTKINLQDEYGISTNEIPQGTYAPVNHNYNAWALFGENLPIGSVRIGGTHATFNRGGYCAYKYNEKVYVFIANSSSDTLNIDLSFKKEKHFVRKFYDINNCGKILDNIDGKTMKVKIPAYSGECWIEK